MKLFHWYKIIAFVGAILWTGLGGLTIASIVLNLFGWAINLIMGLLFISIGLFLYLRTNNFHRFYRTLTLEAQNSIPLQNFLRLDLIFVLVISFLGGLLIIAGASRVFGEGFAIFG